MYKADESFCLTIMSVSPKSKRIKDKCSLIDLMVGPSLDIRSGKSVLLRRVYFAGQPMKRQESRL